MKTAIFYYSVHHGNTKKLLDAIKEFDGEVELVDATSASDADYSEYDRIGLASGVYASKPGKAVMEYAERNLPENKPVFFIMTSSMNSDSFFKPFRKIALSKNCNVVGEYKCQGYDTFGPFKLVGGVSKGHPTDKEISDCVDFYKNL